MNYTNDPVADFARYDAERQAELNRLPLCSECGEPIQTEQCYLINDEAICESCMKEHHRVFTEDVQ